MSRLTWNAPERRFFETGLDRGVLFPKGTPPLGSILSTNLASHPRGIISTNVQEHVKRNRFWNPSFEGPRLDDVWMYNGSVASIIPSATAAHGSNVCRVDSPPTAGLSVILFSRCYPGEKAATRIKMRLKPGMTGSKNVAIYFQIYSEQYGNLGGMGDVNQNVVLTPEWQEVVVKSTTVVPAGGYWFAYQILMDSGSNWVAATDSYEIDSYVVGPTESEFFYGDSPDADSNNLSYSWEGTAHASESIASAPGAAAWYQMNGGVVTQAAGGGIDYRNGVGGSGVYHGSTAPALEVGRHYAARFTIRRIPGEPVSGNVEPRIWDGDSFIGQLAGSSPAFPLANLPADGTPVTLDVLSLAPASVVGGQPSMFFYTASGEAANFHIEDLIMEEVEDVGMRVSTNYFDGSSVSNAYTFAWTGVPNASSSTKREVLTFAVPWDGLTSVEESGGEGARAYYVDGRPFLFLPMPKEYKATLNAYTYPDAFSAIMGLAEVTDGMYLDSQPGQSFDLAYRTLVGNAAEGQEHGYKIHLVYNATVTPGGVNYETLSDSVNPSTMSWEIQAVPVRVEGFRPTAHIVIDTRHMDQHKIDAIEELLYGSAEEVAHMPPPQLVFDILNYGDTIVVTDNGDGTFEVEGSYENVYLVGDGEFRLENIDGQNNGDGTFTISTTAG